jgi:putative FmdB family regulatory protein
MPLFEYRCKECGKEFELLVRHDTVAVCPGCEGAEIEKLLSLPAVKSSGTHELAMRAAKKRDVAQGKEQLYTQLEYERNHDD